MRRGLVHVLAWLLATGAAVALSWWGVHTVMAGTAYDPPRAVPITAAEAAAAHASPSPPATSRPSPQTSGAPRPASPTPSRPPARTATPSPTTAPPSSPTTSSAPAPASDVKPYDTPGGRAVFDIGPVSATLVSATPGTGWSMQVWKTETWIRVEFSRSTDRVTVFCDWHDGPPHVDVQTY
ncbi:hypothetical protein [Streptomyces sp. LaPpAH-108]|uniref:hypothetical protein n=1 Tax=Streptomyces sp. LaPpAH-108 TaxID=1155714 RepID=UPI0004783C21|nr:hypothetical protein [Streptomyces sp. LaPpAH-108]